MKVQDSRCTLKQIAKAAGVSTATVSRVSNGAEGVSRKMRVKVESAISELCYRPNAFAAELARSNAGIPRKLRSETRALSGVITEECQNRRDASEPQPAMSDQLRLLEEENSRLKRLVARLRRGLEISNRLSQ